jgi:1,4-dihydroxy-2-naphthoate octaprenyltransferase
MLGRPATARLFDTLVYGAFVLIVVFAAAGWTPRWTALAAIAAPLAAPLSRIVRNTTEGPPLIRALKGTARLHLLVGTLVALGAAIA